MLTQSFLFDQAGQSFGVVVQAARWLPESMRRLQLVVPRQSCVYSRVSCAGVPSRGMAGFARLQAEQLSPFERFGACAIKQGQGVSQTLHVWLWDSAIEDSFAEQHRGRRASSVLPQSLFSTPPDAAQAASSGSVIWLRQSSPAGTASGQNGAEAQLWRAGSLQDCLYFETPPSASQWVSTLASQPGLAALGWPNALPPSATPRGASFAKQPFAKNLLRAPLRLPSINGALLARALLWLATAGLVAGSAAYLSERLAHQRALADGAESRRQRLAALEPEQQARDSAQALGRWLAAAQALSPQPSRVDTLNQIAVLLTRQGLVLRDLEINPPTVSATVVPATGAELRLTSVIGSIESIPMFYDARFVDVVGGNSFKFTWRLRGAEAPSPGVAALPGAKP